MAASASASAITDHNQWKQFYNQQIVAPQTEGLLFSCDSTVMTAAAAAPTTTMAAAAASSESILSPKGSVTKPIRRRSRASKKTPTTLLNANTTNFRALVQQFTGCPNSSSSSIISLMGVHNKGPITLNFQQGSSSARRTIIPSSFVVVGGGGGSGRGYYYDDHNQVQQHLAATTTNHNDNTLLPWQKQQDHQLQEQESGYSFDEHVMKNSYNDNNSMGVSSDDHDLMMIMDNDFSLHDLTVNKNAFPNHDTY